MLHLLVGTPDTDFNYDGESGGTYTWTLASVDLTAGGSFKMRTNDEWNEELTGITSICQAMFPTLPMMVQIPIFW